MCRKTELRTNTIVGYCGSQVAPDCITLMLIGNNFSLTHVLPLNGKRHTHFNILAIFKTRDLQCPTLFERKKNGFRMWKVYRSIENLIFMRLVKLIVLLFIRFGFSVVNYTTRLPQPNHHLFQYHKEVEIYSLWMFFCFSFLSMLLLRYRYDFVGSNCENNQSLN